MKQNRKINVNMNFLEIFLKNKAQYLGQFKNIFKKKWIKNLLKMAQNLKKAAGFSSYFSNKKIYIK